MIFRQFPKILWIFFFFLRDSFNLWLLFIIRPSSWPNAFQKKNKSKGRRSKCLHAHRLRAHNHIGWGSKAYSRPENPSSSFSAFLESSFFLKSSTISDSMSSFNDAEYKTPPISLSSSRWASFHHLKIQYTIELRRPHK